MLLSWLVLQLLCGFTCEDGDDGDWNWEIGFQDQAVLTVFVYFFVTRHVREP